MFFTILNIVCLQTKCLILITTTLPHMYIHSLWRSISATTNNTTTYESESATTSFVLLSTLAQLLYYSTITTFSIVLVMQIENLNKTNNNNPTIQQLLLTESTTKPIRFENPYANNDMNVVWTEFNLDSNRTKPIEQIRWVKMHLTLRDIYCASLN